MYLLTKTKVLYGNILNYYRSCFVFFQICIGILLMVYVVHKARLELKKALQQDLNVSSVSCPLDMKTRTGAITLSISSWHPCQLKNGTELWSWMIFLCEQYVLTRSSTVARVVCNQYRVLAYSIWSTTFSQHWHNWCL